MDPISALAGGLNVSLRIFEVTYQFRAVGEQTTDLISTTQHVTVNVNEARRLRRLRTSLLSSAERKWMDRIIDDTEEALRSIAQLIEPARVDATTKNQNIGFKNKLLWVFRDNPQVRDKRARMSVCHQSLTTVISCLYAKDVVVIAPNDVQELREREPPPYDPTMEMLVNWQTRKKGKTIARQTAVQSPDPESTTMRKPQALDIERAPISTKANVANHEMPSGESGYHGTRSDSHVTQSHGSSDVELRELDATTTSIRAAPEICQNSDTKMIHRAQSYNDSDGLQAQRQQVRHTPYDQFDSPEETSQVPSPDCAISSLIPTTQASCTTHMYESDLGSPTDIYAEAPCILELACNQSLTSKIRAEATAETLPGGVSYDILAAASAQSERDTDSARPHHPQRTSSHLGQRGRGRWSWLAFHATRSDMRQDSYQQG